MPTLRTKRLGGAPHLADPALLGEPPPDYGYHANACTRCGAFLCRYHDPADDGGLCWPCAPGGEGVVIEVEDGEFRRFALLELTGKDALPAPGVRMAPAVRAERERAELVELMAGG